MAVRQEQVVFGLAVAICGALIWSADGEGRRSPVRPKEREYSANTVPETARALSMATGGDVIVRDLFREPTNARSMPLLGYQAAPLGALPSLAPAPVPGPRAASWGSLLRQVVIVEDVPGLFDGVGAKLQFGEAEDAGDGGDSLAALRDLGLVPDEDAPLADEPNRASLLASYKELYDWILLDEFDYHFGSLDNPDPYRLGDRETEDVRFSEVAPATGMVRYLGVGSVDYSRARVTSFGLANTAVNRVELGAIEREGPITRGNMAERLAFADSCVEGRHEAPRGLEVARDLYGRIATFEPGDPEARLGLARCLEAGFQFELAFAEYEVLTKAFPTKAAVAVAFAQLEERFLLFDQAELRLREAVRFDRGAYVGHWGLGKFLLSRGGMDAEAMTELELAQRFAPDTAEATALRSRIRVDVGIAALAISDIAQARASFESALKADALNQDALAGLFTVAQLELRAGNEAAPPELPADLGSLSAEVLLARGLWSLEVLDWQAAKADLDAAVLASALDPSAALCGLSRLAEVTGYPEEAMDYAERALEALPGNAWALYQRGRLLYQRDDLTGSAESLGQALAAEINFVDAAVLLGQIAMDEQRFTDAERYFDRSRRLEAPRIEVEVRRGMNALFSRDVQAAAQRFEGARALESNDPVALGGIAWCNYERDRADEALNLLAALDDSRRAAGEDDPWRAWAIEQKARLDDHIQKERWVDEFDRKSLRNDWLIEEGAGPLVGLQGEAMLVSGQFRENGEVRVYRRLSAVRFVSLEADLTIGADSASRVGLFVARENRGARRTVSAAVSVTRHKDGSLQTHVLRSGRPDVGPQDVDWLDFPTDRPVRLRIERAGDDKQAVVNVFVDGTPVLENVPMSSFGRTQSDLSIGFMTSGESGRRVNVIVDNIEIVRRKS